MLQLSQRPLLATAADSELFVNRTDELRRLQRAVDLRLNSFVLGSRGSGKTSLLHRFEVGLRDRDVPVFFVNGDEVGDILELVGEAIDREVPGALPESGANSPADWLEKLAFESCVVLLDDSSPSDVHSTFGQHRDDVWRLPIVWVVTGAADRRMDYLEPPADAFFDFVLELDELSEEAATELLLTRARNAGPHDPTARALIDVASSLSHQAISRTPRALLAAARNVLVDDPGKTWSELAEAQARASALGRSAAMVFAELLDGGPVSASDESFLAKFGWTRSRAVQVLRQLEEAGLVVTSTESRGQGRPRTFYTVSPHRGSMP